VGGLKAGYDWHTLAHNAGTFIATEARAPLSAPDEQLVVFVRGTGLVGMHYLRALCRMNLNAIAIPIRDTRLRELEDSGFKTAEQYVAEPSSQKLAIIASASGRHLADALAALERDCHVLVEKPLATTVHGLAQLETVARSRGKKVFAASSLRFADGLQEFRRQLKQIGRVHYVRV